VRNVRLIVCVVMKVLQLVKNNWKRGNACITYNDEFKMICLNKAVLKNVSECTKHKATR